MDDRSFDRLARLLGGSRDRRSGLKALVGGLLGAGGLAAPATDLDGDAAARRDDTHKDKHRGRGRGEDRDRGTGGGPDAGKKRKTCKPACTGGFTCEKVGKKRACVCSTGVTCGEACCALGQRCVDGQCRAAACDPACTNGYVCEGGVCLCPSGVECGNACCASGQTCQDGACAGQPEPDRCIPAGEPCKNVGRACCGGRACASGQGGERDVACYVPKTGACAATAECVYGTVCTDGRCTPPPPPPPPPPVPVSELGAACNPQTNVCTSPGTVCQAYTGDQPVGLSGDYCTLPLGMVCTGDPECSCYSCGYAEGSFRSGGRTGRAARATVCCGQAGHPCGADGDCCEDNVCTAGACAPKTGCTVCADSSCPYDTIQEALDANIRDITVGDGIYYEKNLQIPAGMTSLRIRACGTATPTIDAGSAGRIMKPIPAGTSVVFKRMILKNGSNLGTDDINRGGCFRVDQSGELTLDGVTLSDCYSDYRGGGIYSEGTVTLIGSTVTRCTTNYGGGVAVRAGSLTMTGSSVTNCTAMLYGTSYGDGGGIWVKPVGADRPSVTITDATIAGNIAKGKYGGGVYVESAAVLTMTGVSVTGNRQERQSGYPRGGGMYVYDTLPTTLENCTVENNYSAMLGGGAAIERSYPVTITGGSISRNEANFTSGGAQGGGLYLYYSSEPGAVATVENVAIAGNKLAGNYAYGAGVYIDAYDATVNFTGTTTIENNDNPSTTGTQGGGLHVANGTVTLGPKTLVSGNKVGAKGGGVYMDAGTLNVEGTVRNNTATGNGGGIYEAGATVNLKANARIRNNTAASGDGVYSETSNNVKCSDTPRVCENPGSSATVADNCAGQPLDATCGSGGSSVCRADLCSA